MNKYNRLSCKKAFGETELGLKQACWTTGVIEVYFAGTISTKKHNKHSYKQLNTHVYTHKAQTHSPHKGHRPTTLKI